MALQMPEEVTGVETAGGNTMSDRILGGTIILLSLFYIWAASQTQISFISDPVGPRTFPMIIGALLTVCGAVIVMRPDPEPDWPALSRIGEIMAGAAVLVAYSFALPEAGFVLSTAIAASYLSWRLGSRPLEAIISGIAISVGIYVVFHLILGLSLARGPWGF